MGLVDLLAGEADAFNGGGLYVPVWNIAHAVARATPCSGEPHRHRVGDGEQDDDKNEAA